MEAIPRCYNGLIFNFLLKSYDFGQDEKKFQEFEFFHIHVSFLVSIKSIFCDFFKGLTLGEKIIADTTFENKQRIQKIISFAAEAGISK